MRNTQSRGALRRRTKPYRKPAVRAGGPRLSQQLATFLSRDDLAALYRSPAEARGLPGAAYGRDFYELEQRALFPRTWCVVAAASQIPNPGDVLPVSLAEWPLLLVRGEDREVRAFHNICRHRGMWIVPNPGKGKSVLRCPWHSWTYDLNGRLVATPNIGGIGKGNDPAFRCEDIALASIPCGIWHDAVMVNIDGKAGVLPKYLKALDEELAEDYDFSAFAYIGAWETSYEGNWKVSVEGGIEEYHLPWGHPQFVQTVEEQDVQPLIGPSFAGHRVINRTQSNDASVSPRNVALPVLPTFTNGHDHYYIINIFPSAIIALLGNHYLLAQFTPNGWSKTRIVFHIYVLKEAATSSEYTEARKQLFDAWEVVGEQDRDFIKYVHANAEFRERAGIKTRFTPFWERSVQHFQKLVVEKISGRS